MKQSKKKLLAALVALYGTGGLIGHAHAEGGLMLEEIVVTAQKRETSLIETPMSVNVTTGDAIEQQGIDSALDLSYTVPSFNVQEARKGSQVFTIRGIGNGFGSSSLVGVYLDDIDVTGQGPTQVDLSLYDLERAEVLRGPQGTLYGAGSVGGTVKYVTKKPNLSEMEGKGEVSAFDTAKGDMSYELRGAVNIPVVEDVFALRTTVTYSDEGGWINQPNAGKDDANDSELLNVRVSAMWQVSEAFQALGTVIVHRNDLGATTNANLSLSDSEFTAFGDPQGFDTSYELDYDFYGLTLTYDFDFGTLTSATGLIEIDNAISDTRMFPAMSPPAPVAAIGFERTEYEQAETFTQEIRLNSTGEGNADWVVGFFYRKEESDTNPVGVDVFGLGLFPDNGPYITAPHSQPPESSENEAWAAFANVDYRVSDRLTIGAGIRYFEDERQAFDVVTFDPGNHQKGEFDDVSPRLYASYAVTDDINLYASYAQGFRSGGFNSPALAAMGIPQTYDVENVDSYELGAKMSLLDGALYGEVALFYSDYQDIQGAQVIFQPVLARLTKNLGEAEVQGIDISMMWQATESLTLGLNGNYTDHEYTAVPPGAAQVVGDPLDNVAKYSYSLTADYQFDWTTDYPGYFRLAYNKQGPMYFINRNSLLINPEDESDALALVNAGLGMEVGNTVIEIFGQNLADEDGAITPGRFGGRPAQYRPRSVGIKVGYNF
ncbi:TonB-dependent receptor [Pseudomaricurvus alkylphenolicus]|uniref:TonB-dependent receptor n=1 Tax=Pseudomaricurvus alkylphenolicus TaxID=1306991 RepID=UPI00142113F0|nr:TonB-dependent receptor [Pseudomaricurvus alkylphenolicus]NIB42369.1 TonB-dependent receptor [Pseudomaricurvus alkylphenolicus]